MLSPKLAEDLSTATGITVEVDVVVEPTSIIETEEPPTIYKRKSGMFVDCDLNDIQNCSKVFWPLVGVPLGFLFFCCACCLKGKANQEGRSRAKTNQRDLSFSFEEPKVSYDHMY